MVLKQTIKSMVITHENKTSKLSRNDTCTCGSGKKYKKCCLNSSTDQANNKYRKIPRFSTQEMTDSEELALLAMPLELTFISLDKQYSINDLFIKNTLEILLDKYHYNEDPETIYKILATLYQCVMVRGYRGRAYIEFLNRCVSSELPLLELSAV